MHSSLVRAQNVFGFFTTVAFCVGALIAVSVIISPQDPSASIESRNVQVVRGRPHYYSQKKEEYAHIRFDLDADFSSLFNWNTKQLFVYVLASYPSLSPTTPASQSIIWDTIIPSTALSNPNPFNTGNKAPRRDIHQKPSPNKKKVSEQLGVVRVKNQKPKYQIADVSGKIAERGNVTLMVGWNVQPWVGALTWTQWTPWGRWKGVMGGRSEVFDFPPLKGKKVENVVSGGIPKAAEASPIV
ncbi:MAG: hypothetical protein M1830_009995 [Pleopsidium flavum]|nr:MAG: hypothetical protein M1830_009995 [Pleopsidium flavum]